MRPLRSSPSSHPGHVAQGRVLAQEAFSLLPNTQLCLGRHFCYASADDEEIPELNTAVPPTPPPSTLLDGPPCPTPGIHSSNLLGGTDNLLRGTGSLLRVTDSLLRGTDNPLRGTDNLLRGMDSLPRDTDNLPRDTDNLLRGTVSPLRGTVSPLEVATLPRPKDRPAALPG